MRPSIGAIESASPALPVVLVVEAHEEMRAALRDWLSSSSLPPLSLCEARSMEEALLAAEQADLDFAVVSVELPGANGIETARALRRRRPGCAVVLTSVHDAEALRLAAIEAGAEAFVCKRELTSSLLPLLERTLGKIRAARSPVGAGTPP